MPSNLLDIIIHSLLQELEPRLMLNNEEQRIYLKRLQFYSLNKKKQYMHQQIKNNS